MQPGDLRPAARATLIARRSAMTHVAGMICVSGAPLSLSAQGLVSGSTAYSQVNPRTLVFPRDHGAHPDFRTEWWYLTGWIGQGKQSMGFQVTFFRSRTVHASDNPSRFAPKQLLFAHAAIAQVDQGRILHADRAARSGVAGALVSESDTDVRIGKWQLQRTRDSRQEQYLANIDASDFSMQIRAVAQMPPVLRGNRGVSAKGPSPEFASFYYSRPQLQVAAQVTVLGQARAYTGRAWLDHEWSSSLLMQGASGWDWIGINLFDGGSLMAFRIRSAKGETLWQHVDVRDARDRVRLKSYQGSHWVATQYWRSPRSLIEYPVGFRLSFAGAEYDIVPLMPDQEIDARASTGGFYWEGAVTVSHRGQSIGRGYLELTGYG